MIKYIVKDPPTLSTYQSYLNFIVYGKTERFKMQGKLRTFKTNSQCMKVLNYLSTGASLTCFEAMQKGLTHNLRSRISDLKSAGYVIISEMVKTNSGYIAQYKLKANNEQ